MLRPTPHPGEKWKHFKGGEYVVIAIAALEQPNALWVIYSKSSIAPWRIFSTEDSTVLRFHELLPYPVIVKTSDTWERSEINDSTVWARPLDNFMAVLSSGEGNRASNYYRFERILDAVTTQ